MQDPVKILIVDDSITYRSILSNVLKLIPDVIVTGTASNGKNAMVKLTQLEVDMVLLDIEMPEMDGLETLKEISKLYPNIGVVMVSGLNRHSADITIKALEAGALDFIPKPDEADMDTNIEALRQKFIPILRLFVTKWNLRKIKTSSVPSSPSPPKASALSTPKSTILLNKVDVLIIGVSTGGPNALHELIPKLPGDLGVPILLVQHMPPVFTASLANSLDAKSQLKVKEAQEDEPVLPNVVYIAPGGKHMVVCQKNKNSSLVIGINDDPPENSCRPSVDVLFRSVSSVYGKNILSLIMTGMGSDGALGVKFLKEKQGSYCITQDADSCVVYGMPRAVDEMNLSDERVHLNALADRITTLTKRKVFI